jgi:hypothetical protein
MNITIRPTSYFRVLYCDFMAAFSLFRYLREQKGKKINLTIELE